MRFDLGVLIWAFWLGQELVSCTVISSGGHASGNYPKSATSPAKRHGTTQLTLRAATTGSRVRNQTHSSPTSRQICRRINITSRSSCNDVSHTEMNEAIRCPETLTSLHNLSRLHARVTNQTTDCHHDLGAKTRPQVWVDRHELLVDHSSCERDAPRHWRDDVTPDRLLKANRSMASTEIARRFNIRKCHCPSNRRNQAIGGNEKGKKNHQSLCAITNVLR